MSGQDNYIFIITIFSQYNNILLALHQVRYSDMATEKSNIIKRRANGVPPQRTSSLL
jgi:hypothetical protein